MRKGTPTGGSNTGMSIELVQLAELRDKVTELTRKVERQSLLLESLWEFVKVHGDLEDDALKDMARKLGAAQVDDEGRKHAPEAPQNCPACEEPVKGSRDRCFWCGHKFPAGLFDA